MTRGFMFRMGVLSLIWVATATVFANQANAQEDDGVWTPGKYMRQALEEIMTAVRTETDTKQLGYDADGSCVVGAYLEPDATYQLDRSFVGGNTYYIIAGGDADALDVDLEILDGNGTRITADTDSARSAVVSFTPLESGVHTISMKLYKSNQASFCAFAVMRQDGGYDVPTSNVRTVLDRFLTRCEAASAINGDATVPSGFLTVPNQATVWGVLVKGGESLTISNVRLGTKKTYVMASGDTQVRNIDLFLLDQNDNALSSDTEPDSQPYVVYEPQKGLPYGIKLLNSATTEEATLVLFGVVQISDQ